MMALTDLFQLELTKWVSAKHNMGMAFNRNLWRKIHGCRDLFCNFDDYNWDWSLEHISNNCILNGLQVSVL
jgi:alpha-1,6-mannosyl-glycoprotein beta-1,2-N-acetylglucosaminyltransferase